MTKKLTPEDIELFKKTSVEINNFVKKNLPKEKCFSPKRIWNGFCYGLQWLAAAGSTASLAFLSFTGAMAFNVPLPLSTIGSSIFFAVFAIMIEYRVFLPNIRQGAQKIRNAGKDYLYKAVSEAVLDQTEFVEDDSYQTYQLARKRYQKIDKLYDRQKPIHWLIDFIASCFTGRKRKFPELAAEKKRLETYLNIFREEHLKKIRRLLLKKPSNVGSDLDSAELKRTLPGMAAKVESQVKRMHSRGGVRFIQGISLLIGGSALFATLSAIQSGLDTLDIAAKGAQISWDICWPIAALCGLGYIAIMSNNMIETLYKFAVERSARATAPSPNCTVRKILHYTLLGFLLLLASCAAVAIAWTWRNGGVDVGLQILPFGDIGVKVFIGGLAIFTLIPGLIWDVTHALEAFEGFKRLVEKFSFSALCAGIKKKFQKLRGRDQKDGANYRFFNPFRAIEGLTDPVLRAAVLCTHAIGVGSAGNNTDPRIPATVPALIEAGFEVLTDVRYFEICTTDGEDKENKEDEKIQQPELGYVPPSMNASLSPTPRVAEAKEAPSPTNHNLPRTQRNGIHPPPPTPAEAKIESATSPMIELPEAEHTHGDLAGVLIAIALIGLKICRFVWDVLFAFLGSITCRFKTGFCELVRISARQIFLNPTLESFYATPTMGAISLPRERARGSDGLRTPPEPSQSRLLSEPLISPHNQDRSQEDIELPSPPPHRSVFV